MTKGADVQAALARLSTGHDHDLLDGRLCQRCADLALVTAHVDAGAREIADAARPLLAMHDADALDQQHTAAECAGYGAVGFRDCRAASVLRALLPPAEPNPSI